MQSVSEASRPGPSGGFVPPPLLAQRHVQSIITQAPWRRRRARIQARQLLACSEPELLDCGDNVRLAGFLSDAGDAARGLVVLLHGWEGSAESGYILSAGGALFDAGFSVFRLNFRDHGNTQSLNEGLFHSCRIDEVVGAVRRIRRSRPDLPFAIVGQSLGGNFALRVAARAEEAGIDIGRVLAICPVLKPASTMHALDSGLWIYRRYFLDRWRRSLAEKAASFPHLYDFGDLRRFDTLTATTEYFVEYYTEFESLEAYLEGYAVTGEALSAVVAPTRIILAADDPVIPVGDIRSIARPDRIEIEILDRGGHCGFVDRLNGPSWIDRQIVSDLSTSLQAAVEL